jgi:Tol biopolymer transport system component
MTWPQGTPRQLTTDANAGQVSYSGLTWSPDGTRLAVLRLSNPGPHPTSTLVLFAPDGTRLASVNLPTPPANTPFAWSPDGTLIAYHTDEINGTTRGLLTILDGQTGATKQTLLHDEGPNGVGNCGGGTSPLVEAVQGAHHSWLGVDTFTWTPDQKSLLLPAACGEPIAERVDLSSGNTTAGYPAGASYQPSNSQVMVGLEAKHTPQIRLLELADASGVQQRVLTSESLSGNGPVFVTSLGMATWTRNGQAIYYEHDNGIWSMSADGASPHQIVAGTPNDSQDQATVVVLPSISPDGSRLLYLRLQGANGEPGVGSVASQCFVAGLDGSNAVSLPQGTSLAVWRP